MGTPIENQKLLYHLTCIDNLASIFEYGLLPRAAIVAKGAKGYVDVADCNIIEGREHLCLENFVPFHFFAKNPFDYAVAHNHKDKIFVLIAVRRSFAEANKWKVIARHPLASEGMELLDYSEGIESIDWETMNQRDFDNEECKSICMAECLSPNRVLADNFLSIAVLNHDQKREVDILAKSVNIDVHVNVSPHMLVSV